MDLRGKSENMDKQDFDATPCIALDGKQIERIKWKISDDAEDQRGGEEYP